MSETSVMTPEERIAMGRAAYAIACACTPMLAYWHSIDPERAEETWLNGWLTGQRDAYNGLMSSYGPVH